MINSGRGLVLVVFLASCGGVGQPSTNAPRVGAQFTPDTFGLAVVGTGQRIDFGRAPSGVIAALDRELGRSRALGIGGCPAGIVQQAAWDDLVLTFTVERFVGWKTAETLGGQTCG